jgi:P pilus assembly chaperone PapD
MRPKVSEGGRMTPSGFWSRAAAALALGAVAILAGPAEAQLVMNQVIVDFAPGQPTYEDVELWNSSRERLYLVSEPAEMVSPGLPAEHRVTSPDPAQLGLLVTPNRMILEPGQRRLLRVAAIAAPASTDRIYRVMVKPVTGGVSADQTALKILVGYDVLVIVRPLAPAATITAAREGGQVVLHNEGNTNAELFDGVQCDAQGGHCTELPAKRLYAGATWKLDSARSTPFEYSVKVGSQTHRQKF